MKLLQKEKKKKKLKAQKSSELKSIKIESTKSTKPEIFSTQKERYNKIEFNLMQHKIKHYLENKITKKLEEEKLNRI